MEEFYAIRTKMLLDFKFVFVEKDKIGDADHYYRKGELKLCQSQLFLCET